MKDPNAGPNRPEPDRHQNQKLYKSKTESAAEERSPKDEQNGEDRLTRGGQL